MPTYFTPKTLAFLRALARNNDREWFKARKGDFDRHVKAPLLALLEHLASDLHTFAPELACSPERVHLPPVPGHAVQREQVAAQDQRRAGLPARAASPRHAGAGLYMSLDARHVFIGGGMWHPERASLQAVREHIAGNYGRLRAIVESPSFRKRFGKLSGDSLTRVPRGFPADHPAGEYLKLKDLVAMQTFPGEFATKPRFYGTLVAAFQDLTPFIRFLNEARTTPTALTRPLTTE